MTYLYFYKKLTKNSLNVFTFLLIALILKIIKMFKDYKLLFFSLNKKKATNHLIKKKQFKYLQIANPYCLVCQNSWLFILFLEASKLTNKLVFYIHKFSKGCGLYMRRYTWVKENAIRKTIFENSHTVAVQKFLSIKEEKVYEK